MTMQSKIFCILDLKTQEESIMHLNKAEVILLDTEEVSLNSSSSSESRASVSSNSASSSLSAMSIATQQ